MAKSTGPVKKKEVKCVLSSVEIPRLNFQKCRKQFLKLSIISTLTHFEPIGTGVLIVSSGDKYIALILVYYQRLYESHTSIN